MNDRTRATAAGQKKYQMTKPCRRDHMGERYTANGLCVACVEHHDALRSEANKKARILANTKRGDPGAVFSGLARPALHGHLSDVCDIFNYGSDAQKQMIIEAIQAVRSGVQVGIPVRTQGELNRAVLAAAVDFERVTYVDGSPLNQGVDPDGDAIIKIGGYWYRTLAIKAVWDGQRDIIRPAKYAGELPEYEGR